MSIELTGLEKASILMTSLGAATSAKVFDQLSADERDLLGTEIVKLRHVDSITRQRVLEEVDELIKQGIPQIAAKPVEPELPLKWLEKLDSSEVAGMLAGERAQNIALVLAHLAPQAAASILAHFNDNLRNQVTLRLASMRPVSKEAVEAVDEAMRKRAASEVKSTSHNRETLLNILGSATDRVKDSVSGVFGKSENPLARSASRNFTSPEDILKLPGTQIKELLSRIDSRDICLALRVASDELRETVLNNLSGGAGYLIETELAASVQIRVREVEEAQQRIVEALCGLDSEAEKVEAEVGRSY